GDKLAPAVHFVEKGSSIVASPDRPGSFTARIGAADRVSFTGRIRHAGCDADVTINVRAGEDELVVSGRTTADGRFEGLASMSFSLGSTLSHTQVIVPTTGGNAYRSDGFRSVQSMEWPITWEAAMLQVQGKHGGILICAFEPFKRFKNLHLTPGRIGWNIVLESENNAPFEGKRRVESLEWHIRPYKGEWRRGASIYRDWHRRTFRPNPSEEPAWVRDIRAEIHCTTDPAALDALVKAGVDPGQTILYVSGWRAHPYDVNYPDYTPADDLAPFVAKAHELGFRVMLHVNYFGCDPKMPDYEKFKPFQIRHRYSGALQWWEWPPGQPSIRFAYINPASREWRTFFVAKMADLVRRTGVDALHLDQTLCIFNDKSGLVDGLNMAQGNLALHRELRSAIPGVVLSGEGLNEVTMIHEAFAQRHVAGVYPHTQTFNRAAIKQTHPICAYLFGARTRPYDYLASGSPDSEQFHLAWRDAYRHWGVLPGFGWPEAATVAKPTPSARQALQEIIVHQKNRLEPYMDGPW
ncbi:MAG: DUF6259 domain-containing protein, partial [Armatimonadota bacterium]